MLPPPLPLAPPVEPLALQQVDKAQSQVGVGAVGVGVEQLTGAAQGLQPEPGLPKGIHPREQDLGQGPQLMPRFDLRGRAPAKAARVKEPVLPRQSRLPPRNPGSSKGWPSGVLMVEGAMGASASIVPFAAKSRLNSGLLAVDPKRMFSD